MAWWSIGGLAFVSSIIARRIRGFPVEPATAAITGMCAGALGLLAHRLCTAVAGRVGLYYLNTTATSWPSPAARSPLGEFIRVIGIGETRLCGGASLTLLSLEEHSDGFLLHSLFRVNGARRERFATGWFPQISFVVTQPGGQSYEAFPTGFQRSGDGWRLAALVRPALKRDPGALMVEAEEVRWRSARDRSAEAAEPGPWTFTVSLGRENERSQL